MLPPALRRRLRPRDPEEGGELNVVPYLDIMMNLVMFVLLSSAGLASFGVVNATASHGGDEGGGPPLLVTVLIGERGFTVAGPGGVSPPIARRADGALDFDALGERLAALKADHPGVTRVVVGAGPKTTFQAVIATLDTCRERAGRPLFPDASLMP